MKKTLARIGIGLAGLIAAVIIGVFVLSTIRWNRDYSGFDVDVGAVPVPTDAESVERGEHLVTTHICQTCHGDNLAGGYLVNEPVLAVISAPNLTSGVGGIGATNTDDDWVRAIRYGVGHDGRGLVGMPSRVFNEINDEDLGALIAYLNTLPPVDNELPSRRIGPMFRILLLLGEAPSSEAAIIDATAPRPAPVEPSVTVDYGAYLATTCTACHGTTLNGGTIRDFDGELVIALNLTPGGALVSWSEEDFVTTMRTGITPTGRTLSDAMPWQYVGQMTDDELAALWLYLQSLPTLEQGLERTDQ